MLIERKDMTTPISTTPTLNLNLASAIPPSAEATKTDNPSEKPLSSETQQALDRWYPKQDDWYGLFPQANKNKLSDFLAHPVKNISVLLGLGTTAVPAFLLSLNLIAIAGLKTNPKAMIDPENKTLVKLLTRASFTAGAWTLFWGGLTFADYFYQKNRNKDTLQGIQTLGEQATRQEWLDYKEVHPELKQA
jgi:hypothetical protein